jgi:catechol 2,3-dioxygenase-like lactoylglutathione lyase family enzyme
MAMLANTRLAYCSFVVPDLDAAVQFFTTWLGFELLSEEGPVASGSDDRITRQYAMPDKAIGRFALLGQAGQQIELREWVVYGQGLNPLRESTVPGCSIALRIANFDAAIAQLKQIPRMRILEINHDAGFVYCLTPYGFQLQLIRDQDSAYN